MTVQNRNTSESGRQDKSHRATVGITFDHTVAGAVTTRVKLQRVINLVTSMPGEDNLIIVVHRGTGPAAVMRFPKYRVDAQTLIPLLRDIVGDSAIEYDQSESPIERLFWNAGARDIPGIEQQLVIGRYRVDFAIPSLKIAIELDGHDFHKTKEQRTYDAQRQRELEAGGWRVIRFTGSEVHKDPNGCVLETSHLVNIISGGEA